MRAIVVGGSGQIGGWLQAWGKPDQGAQFRLTLPRRAGTPLRHSPLPLVPEDAAEVVA